MSESPTTLQWGRALLARMTNLAVTSRYINHLLQWGRALLARMTARVPSARPTGGLIDSFERSGIHSLSGTHV